MINFFKYLHYINTHRFIVFLLCCKAGIPFQGIKHDLSCYSPTEFFEGLKYYKNNKISPYKNSQKENGYSLAWLHHKGRNKHHSDYWFDYNAPLKAPIIPFNYCVEMVCDRIAIAKMNYGKKYSNMSPYYAWNKTRDNEMLNRHIQGFMTETFELLGAYGEKKVINKKYLKKIYNKNIQKKKGEL